jgi:holo-[acyl-carrier protein] synthase
MSNFNVGIDCEDIKRWHRMLPKLEEGTQHKLFTEAEHQYCKSFKNPAAHYAARWCAKEALLKALYPFCKVDLRNIEIANDKEGVPYFIVSDPEVAKLNLTIRVSLSHSKETAMAIAVVAVGFCTP